MSDAADLLGQVSFYGRESIPAAWLIHARVAKIRHLLAQTDFTLRDIATQAGFARLHTRARLIKEATGLSPSQYRDQHRTNP